MDAYVLQTLLTTVALGSPIHFAFFILFFLGLGLFFTRSRVAGTLLVLATGLHALGLCTQLARDITIYSPTFDPSDTYVFSVFGALGVLFTTLKTAMLIGAIWAGRTPPQDD